ncbi:MAG: hypothetical protein JNM50_06100 [Chromatiales bacterium]|nr:hypothetical protein [Chromatiales bacterium]
MTTNPLETLRWERTRKLAVREAFRAGLAWHSGHAADPVPFYRACAAYLVPAQQRLIDQDRRLADLLAPRVPAEAAADHAGIESLRERLVAAGRSLQEFAAACDRLERDGADARPGFEAAAAEWLDFVINVLGARSHSLRHLTTTLFSPADWDVIAGITPAVLAAEEAAFAEVVATAPPGLAPGAPPAAAGGKE